MNGVLLNKPQVIALDEGDILRCMRAGDSGYYGFGDAYVSIVKHGAIKAWKNHREMTVNLCVIVGEVLFVIHDRRPASSTRGQFREERLSRQRYRRLTIAPGLWFGFQGIGAGENMILNVADRAHDPDEVDRVPIDGFDYVWER